MITGDSTTNKTDIQAGCFKQQEPQGKFTYKAQGRTALRRKHMGRGGEIDKENIEKSWKSFCCCCFQDNSESLSFLTETNRV